VSDKLETAVNLAWTAGSNSTRFGIAAKYQLDKDASVSVSGAAEAFRMGWMRLNIKYIQGALPETFVPELCW